MMIDRMREVNNRRFMNCVTAAYEIFYALKKTDLMCYHSNTWERQLSRLFLDVPKSISDRSRTDALKLLVRKQLATISLRKSWGLMITLGEKGRVLSRS